MIDLVYPSEPAPLEKGCKPTRSTEMLPVIDPTGVVIAQATRNFCHGSHRPLHPVVHLHIVNREGCIYLQKRSATKKLLPNRWDTAVGGHISYGEMVEEALYREASEELGFRDFNPLPIESYLWESAVEREMISVFAAVGNFNLKPDGHEVTAGRYWPMAEIEANLGKGVFTPNFELEFSKYKDTLLSFL